MMYNYSSAMNVAVSNARLVANSHHTNRITIEMLLHEVVKYPSAAIRLEGFEQGIGLVLGFLKNHIDNRHYNPEKIQNGILYAEALEDVLQQAQAIARLNGSEEITMEFFILGIFSTSQTSYARKWLEENLLNPHNADAAEVALLFREGCIRSPRNEEAQAPEAEDDIPYCRRIPPMCDDGWKLIGREKELSLLMGVLCRMQRPNPILIGEHGVGKSAIVSGLDTLLRSGQCPENLRGKRILQFNLAEAMAGAIYRGDLEQRLSATLDAVAKDGNIILFIDKIHDIVGAGKLMDSTIDATSLIVPYLEDRRISMIGATTFSEYRKAAVKCPYLESLFQRVDIDEPTPAESGDVLRELTPLLERFHKVSYDKDTIPLAVSLGARFSQFGRLPGSAFCLLDEAGVEAGRDRKRLREKKVSREHVKAVFSRLSGIDITGDDLEDIRQLPVRLRERVYGQGEAIDQVADAICASKVGLCPVEKPIASFLFVGTTGVGKTFLARELARLLGLPLHRLDMSEYSDQISVTRLIGASAGYIGYEDGGVLTNLVKDTPYCVLLLDEMEKAHEKIYNLLLQVMDAGILTDGQGQRIDFRNVILIMTSNAGARDAARTTVGFNPGVRGSRSMEDGVRAVFPPEFINRLTAQIIFNSVDEKMAGMILDERIRELEEALEEKAIGLEITPEAREGLLKEGYSPLYGARELERVIVHKVRPMVVREILYGGLGEGGRVTIHYDGARFSCSVSSGNNRRIKRLFGMLG